MVREWHPTMGNELHIQRKKELEYDGSFNFQKD